MRRPRGADFDLAQAVRQRGFSPRLEDIPALFELLAAEDGQLARAAERALALLGQRAGELAAATLQAPISRRASATADPASSPLLRPRLCALIGRIAAQSGAVGLRAPLLAALEDPDPRTRRAAARAIGKLGDSALEGSLLAAWAREEALAGRRAIAAALGNVGGQAALELLDGAAGTADGELARIISEAMLKLRRDAGRASGNSRIDPCRLVSFAPRVRLHCRAGLEAILAAEVSSVLVDAAAVAAGRVEGRLGGALQRLLETRTMLRLGFLLPAERQRPGEPDVAPAVARALTSDAAWGLFSSLTEGEVRYRLEWRGAGHRRAVTYQVVLEAARLRPALVNDPRGSPWEVVVEERRGVVLLEACPRPTADQRFAYRRRLLPASSHPTIAAALALAGGVRSREVVWDPFVGAGTELVERARLGRCLALYGSDDDPRAIEAARENLAAAGVEGAKLFLADALALTPPQQPTLIISNPPLGRRLRLREAELEDLLCAFVERAAHLLAPAGRLVWISPLAAATAGAALRLGLTLARRQRVDMGGFHAELQVIARPR